MRVPPSNKIRKFYVHIVSFVTMFLFNITSKYLSLPCYNELQITTCEDNNNKEPKYSLGKQIK